VFVYNSDRKLKIYATNEKAAQMYFAESYQRKEREMYSYNDFRVSVGRETIASTRKLGRVEMNLGFKHLQSDGKVIRSTTTVTKPYQVVSWINQFLGPNSKEIYGFPISIEVEEVLTT
jgi:hypothetical protein